MLTYLLTYLFTYLLTYLLTNTGLPEHGRRHGQHRGAGLRVINIFSLTKGEIPQSLSDFTLSVIPQREVNYSVKTWDELYQLSLDTFVDESEEKKLSGAGAGLTDND